MTTLDGQQCVVFPNRPHATVLEDPSLFVRKATIVIESKVDGVLLGDVVRGRTGAANAGVSSGVALVEVEPALVKVAPLNDICVCSFALQRVLLLARKLQMC